MNDRSQTLCQEFKISYITDLSSYPFVRDKLQLIPYPMAKSRLALPVDEQEDFLIVALEDPLDLESLEAIRCYTGKKIREICAPREAIEAAIEQCYHQKEDAASALIATLKENSSDGLIEK